MENILLKLCASLSISQVLVAFFTIFQFSGLLLQCLSGRSCLCRFREMHMVKKMFTLESLLTRLHIPFVLYLIVFKSERSVIFVDSQSVPTFRGPCVFEENTTDVECDGARTVFLGGLFPLHKPASNQAAGSCAIDIQTSGYQRMEAMRLAVEQVNRMGILPGVTLAFEMRDTCASAKHTNEQVVRFINRAIDSTRCDAGDSLGQGISGVIGAASSSVSIAAADLLRLFRIPQISYASTSAALSNKDRYGYFMRTLPPDNFQAQAIRSLLEVLDVRYVSLLYSKGSYGSRGADEVRREIANLQATQTSVTSSTCIAIDRSIGANVKTPGTLYREVLDDLLGVVGRNATTCVLFAGSHAIGGLFDEAVRLKYTSRFSADQLWITSDSWASRDLALHPTLLPLTRGSLGVIPRSTAVKQFDTHFLSLHPDNNPSGPLFNPWLNEFWQRVFRCDPDSSNPRERITCRGNSLANASHTGFRYQQNSKVAFVIDAVRAFAYGLRAYQIDKCGADHHGLCPEMLSGGSGRRLAINGEELLQYLLKLQFTSSAGTSASFTAAGDLATAVYDITNLQVDPTTGLGRYVKVGSWERLPPDIRPPIHKSNTDGFLSEVGCLDAVTNTSLCVLFRVQLNLTAIQWRNGQYGVQAKPAFRCSDLCHPGASSSSIGHPFLPSVDKCCWKCVSCENNWFTPNQFQKCRQCPAKKKSSFDRTACVNITVDYWSWEHAEAIGVTVLAVMALLVTVAVAAVGIVTRNMLLTHAGLNIVSLLYCLGGTLGLCTAIFVSVHRPTNLLCTIFEIWVNLSACVLLSSMTVQFPFIIKEWLDEQKKADDTQGSKPNNQCEDSPIINPNIPGLHIHIGIFVSLVPQIAFLSVVVSRSLSEVYDEIKPNEKWVIGCRTSIILQGGLIYNGMLAILTIVLRLFCLRKRIEIHATMKKASMLMSFILLMSISTIIALSVISSIVVKMAILLLILLIIVFGLLAITIIPGVLKTVSVNRVPGGSWKNALLLTKYLSENNGTEGSRTISCSSGGDLQEVFQMEQQAFLGTSTPPLVAARRQQVYLSIDASAEQTFRNRACSEETFLEAEVEEKGSCDVVVNKAALAHEREQAHSVSALPTVEEERGPVSEDQGDPEDLDELECQDYYEEDGNVGDTSDEETTAV